ncbi:hypothetical protein GGS23DRAFT_182436 [Durotheca rogersii]|uniref:uncharacterized protein n=1 Tax=Durotheca rogersii TaxID=419775 RepID=UPI00222026EE|nr:uncharacterized protein GGS23DRAFT_182436 [Durotheca rogersii]KAI5867554.1 hypothetical protein GGS23DRAFT_182436 [Durotheca rogersii]
MATEDANDGPDKSLKIENTQKRDALIEIEKKYQKSWADGKVFELNAPSITDVPFHSLSPAELRAQRPKFFATVPYPYSNGSLHLGHAFTISKAEFATRYARMQGKQALFPFAFHCTGMPIKACADRLTTEVELFGKNFERYDELEGEEEDTANKGGSKEKSEDVAKFSSNKSKASAKTAKAKYQFQIMLAQGIPREEIHLFADPLHWVHVFPEMAIRDATNFGLGVDWRRSFVTTDANPFYDSFVRWQMNQLKQLGKVKFGKRYTVYSPKDKQACMDHDRSEGEGVTVQEYTAIKMRVLEWSEASKSKVQAAGLPSDAQVYFVAATLRPETMYGQTCCFVGSKVKYGVFATAKEKEYLFVTERAARNIAFQPDTFAKWGEYDKVVELNGADVIGTLVNAPLSVHNNGVRVLPMETVKETKGTGVVTCVPSDSPDDYAMTVELSNKPDYYGIKKEWAALEILPIIETPTYGKLTAPELVTRMKIVSPKDPRLPEAKEVAYKEGFYQGVMIYGEFSGKTVQEAKGLVQKHLIEKGDAFPYAEPDGLVISRSKDECVAAHLDQWYLNYGTDENGGDGAWCDQVLQHLEGDLNTFSTEVKRQFESTLGWLSQWACARSYGLGSKLPWDPDFLVESLSDSTIYQAYYTVAHYLHSDLYGKEPGIGRILPHQMTDAVWNYLMARSEQVPEDGNGIPLETLHAMRREFEYWYPLDLRTSGKDLIQNHLTFFLYNHIAIWPSEYWPRGIRANGHLLLNGEKMSKSTGNFLTLHESVEKYGTDAARIALANAGDSIDDANFEESVANKTILKLYELRKWLQDVLQGNEGEAALRSEDSEPFFWDTLFEHHMNQLVAETKSQYDQYLFKNVLRSGFYDLTSARDFYRDATKAAGIPMHRKLIRRYAELQALVLTPIAPHWAEYVWLEVLNHKNSILTECWPETAPADAAWLATLSYIQNTMSNVTAAEAHQQKKLAKGKKVGGFDPKKPFKVAIFFTTALPDWQDRCISLVSSALEELGLIDMNSIGKKIDKKETKRAMPFIRGLKDRLDSGETKSVVLNTRLPFDERKALTEMIPVLTHMLQPRCGAVSVFEVKPDNVSNVVSGEPWSGDLPGSAASAVPGAPSFHFENLEESTKP